MTHLLDILEASAARVPERPAYTDEANSLTFAALRDGAKQVGSFLLPFLRAGHGAALLLDDRQAKSMAALLGVCYAGGYYAPLSPRTPEKRLGDILARLRPDVVLYDEKGEKAVQDFKDKYVCLPCPAEAPVDENALAARRQAMQDTDTVFVLFTSGSTGVPKGVARSHKSLCLHTQAVIRKYGFTENTRFGNQCPAYYANCVMDLYPSLALGAVNCLLPGRALSFPREMADKINELHIEEITMTPSSYAQLVPVLEKGLFPHLRCLIQTGEPASAEVMTQWQAAAPQAVFWNLYGSTETYSVAAQAMGEKTTGIAPVGKPFDEVSVCFLNGENERRGEITVSSPFLAQGYWQDEERNRASFFEKDGLRYFRTGDHGYLNENGQLVVTGRMDGQIKHKGYRMELGEVEAAGKALNGCDHCCCLYLPESDTLACFYTGTLAPKELLRGLKAALPRYCLPEKLTLLQAMPISQNGKIDRQKLLADLRKGE